MIVTVQVKVSFLHAQGACPGCDTFSNVDNSMIHSKLILASANLDYVAIFMNLTFPVGSSDNATQCIDVIIIDDNILERNEIITVELDITSIGAGARNDVISITILDDDG